MIESVEDLDAWLVYGADDGDAHACQGLEDLNDGKCRRGIQPRGRLVKNEHHRRRGKLYPDTDALALPAGDDGFDDISY